MLPTLSYGRRPPSSVSHSGCSPVIWPFLLFPGHGGNKERERDKLVAWPLSHLFLSVFWELQIHLSFPTSQIGPLLTHSVTWLKTLLSDPQSPPKSEGKQLNQRFPLALNLCLSKFSKKMNEKTLPLGSFPVGRGGDREFGDFWWQPTPPERSRQEVYLPNSLPFHLTPIQAPFYSLSPEVSLSPCHPTPKAGKAQMGTFRHLDTPNRAYIYAGALAAPNPPPQFHPNH